MEIVRMVENIKKRETRDKRRDRRRKSRECILFWPGKWAMKWKRLQPFSIQTKEREGENEKRRWRKSSGKIGKNENAMRVWLKEIFYVFLNDGIEPSAHGMICSILYDTQSIEVKEGRQQKMKQNFHRRNGKVTGNPRLLEKWNY